MEIFLFHNTNILKNNCFQNQEQLFSYLKFDKKTPTNRSFTSQQDLTTFNFKEIFNLEVNEPILNYDFAIVKDFPFLGQGKFAAFRIIKKKFIGNLQWELTFDFSIENTFDIDKAFSQNEAFIERKHVNYLNEFNDKDLTKWLKNDSILRLNQPIPSVEFTEIKKAAVLSPENDWPEMKFAIFTCKAESLKEVGDGSIPAVTTIGNNDSIKSPYFVVMIPLLFSWMDDSLSEWDIHVQFKGQSKTINLKDAYAALSKSPNILDCKIIDFPLGDITNYDFEKRYISIEGASAFLSVDVGDSNIWVPGYYDLAARSQFIDLKVEDKFFKHKLKEFAPSDNEWNLPENALKWEMTNEIFIDLEPFKFFSLNLKLENGIPAWVISNNNLSLDFSQIKITRSLAPAPLKTTIIDSYPDYINEGGLLFNPSFKKIDRSLFYAFENDKWEEYNNQKMIQGAQDFLNPVTSIVAGAGAGFAAGGPIGAVTGAVAGGALSLFGKVSKRQKLKHEISDFTSNIEGVDSIYYNFDEDNGHLLLTRNISCNVPKDAERESLLWFFHVYGAYHFETKKLLSSENIFMKERFNFLKISNNENNLFIINNEVININFFGSEFLKILKEGIHIWNYDKSFEKYIFRFDIKNPDLKEKKQMDETILFNDKDNEEYEVPLSETLSNFAYMKVTFGSLELPLYPIDPDYKTITGNDIVFSTYVILEEASDPWSWELLSEGDGTTLRINYGGLGKPWWIKKVVGVQRISANKETAEQCKSRFKAFKASKGDFKSIKNDLKRELKENKAQEKEAKKIIKKNKGIKR